MLMTIIMTIKETNKIYLKKVKEQQKNFIME